MPIYTYQASTRNHCDFCVGVFELQQKMSAPRTEACPQCGAQVRRVITASALTSGGPDMGRDNLEKHGFTQYRKSSKGVYEKTAGKGPGIITDKD